MSLLKINNLTLHKGGKTILNKVSLAAEAGKIYAVAGPNGAGKSSLAYAVMGLDGYTDLDGEILFSGQSLAKLNVCQRAELGITLAWQEPARFEGVTVKKYLAASSRRNNNSPSYEEALNQVGLDPQEYLNRAVDTTLSGGERKRIELASIVMMQPQLVILDEPDSGIDIESLNHIFSTLTYLQNTGTTVIVITHSPTVLQHANYAWLLCSGQVLDQGPTKVVYQYFKNKCLTCLHKNIPDKKKFV